MEPIFEFVGRCADGVMAVDSRQSIVLFNDAASRILGYDADEVLGQPCYAVMRAGGCDLCRRDCAVITAARRLALVPTRSVTTRTRSGRSLRLSLTTILVPAGDETLSAAVHVFQDSTREHEVATAAIDFARFVQVGNVPAPSVPCEPVPSGPDHLTARERAVMRALAAGESAQAVAGSLRISPRTVRNHVSNVIGKLGVHSRLEAVTYCIRHRLI